MAHLTSVGSGVDDAGATTQDSDAITISGTNKVLYVMAFSSDSTPAVPSGVVLDPTGVNEALTKLDDTTHGTYGWASIWRLIAPSDVTAKIVRVTWGSNQSERGVVCWVETGLDQTTPNGAVSKNTGTTSTAITSGAVTTTTGDRVLNFAHAIDTGTFGGAGQFTSPSGTERIDGAISGIIYDVFAAQEQTATGSSTDPSWTLASDGTGWASFAFKVTDASGSTGGAMSATGASTVTFGGASRIDAAASMPGVAVSNFTGRGVASGAISTTGVTTSNFAGRSVVAGRFTVAGVAAANFTGAGRGAGALSITGVAASNLTASSQAAGALSAVAAGTANFVGAGAADGQAAIYFVGAGTAAFSGSARNTGALSVIGAGAANITGGSINAAPLSVTGVSTVSLVGTQGSNTVAGDWSVTGVGTANFASRSTAASGVLISGVGSASFIGDGGLTIEPEVPVVPDATNAGGGGNSWEQHRKSRRKKIAAQDQADVEALLAFLEQQEAA